MFGGMTERSFSHDSAQQSVVFLTVAFFFRCNAPLVFFGCADARLCKDISFLIFEKVRKTGIRLAWLLSTHPVITVRD
jgi:hypothetical protein